MKGQRKRQESTYRKGNRKEKIRGKNPWNESGSTGFCLNFGGGDFKKSWRRERNPGWDLGPQSSALAHSVLSLCLYYLGSPEAPSATSHEDPTVHFHSPISWYKDPCLASTWGGFRGAGVSIFIISSQHCFHWPEGRALVGVGCLLPCYVPFHTFLK